eukprot:gene7283-11601_t
MSTDKQHKEIDRDLQKFYFENGCNETFERSQYRLMGSFVFGILTAYSIICKLFVGNSPFAISQLLQGSWFNKEGKAVPVTNESHKTKMFRLLSKIYIFSTIVSLSITACL